VLSFQNEQAVEHSPGALTGMSILAPDRPTLYTPVGSPAHIYFLWPGPGSGLRISSLKTIRDRCRVPDGRDHRTPETGDANAARRPAKTGGLARNDRRGERGAKEPAGRQRYERPALQRQTEGAAMVTWGGQRCRRRPCRRRCTWSPGRSGRCGGRVRAGWKR